MEQDREFNIILWGATGAVGRRVARHLASRCAAEGDVRWAIGGRNLAKLESVRSTLGPAARDIPIIEGDSHDVSSLDALAARTKVVCSTVGPYAKYGSELVAACVRFGTHYADISGEPYWIRKMIDAHQAAAEQTGARIVHACGFDSIPSDLGVFYLQRETKKQHGRPCRHIKMRVDDWWGGFSGGTAASLIYRMEEGRHDPTMQRGMTEPYYLNPDDQREGPDPPDEFMSAKVEYDEDLGAWTKPFFMAPINTKIVRRSNAVQGYPYGSDFRYEEARSVGGGPLGWVKAKTQALGYVGFILAAAIPPTRSLLKRFVLPKSGHGPSQEVREHGFWRFVFVGRLDDGNVMRARVRGEGDPGVESTSRMLVEATLCLSQDSGKIPVGGGSWTPASAMGELLLPRLITNAGLSFELV